MFSTKCPDCHKGFCRKDAMLRHFKQKHNVSLTPPPPPQGTPPPPPPPPPPEGTQMPSSPPEETMIFYHPFTMMISGPTACGKTTMVKDLLMNHTSKIQPGIQRIVWLYKRWQPLYTINQNSVVPKVEFVQGIPTGLDEDDFFNPRINNLLILDDLFSEAGKDKRITDMFTEGSHHRSLSVIAINQNLFGNKDPTQRRNCHYLVLFNNPVDSQSVMTLARQMYPRQSDMLLKQFSKATKYPYGYLLVDLKPFTQDNHRLKCIRQNYQNSDFTDNVIPVQTIKEEVLTGANHSTVGVQTSHIEDNAVLEKSQNNSEYIPEQIMENKGQACDDCGQLFDTVHDVQRHVKNGWCPEHRDQRKRKHDDMNDSDTDDDSTEDNLAYVQLWKRARENNSGKFNKIYNTLRDKGEDSDTAQEMAEERIKHYDEKDFFGKYQTLIDNYILPLRNNKVHQQIMAEIDKLISKGHNTTSAVNKSMRKHKNTFKSYLIRKFPMMMTKKNPMKTLVMRKVTHKMYKRNTFSLIYFISVVNSEQ